MFLDLGKLCSQLVCVAPFIISKLPCSVTSETVCLVCLYLNENFTLKVISLTFIDTMIIER